MFPNRGFFVSLLLGNLLVVGTIFGAGFLVIFHEVNQRSLRLAEQSQEQLLGTIRSELQESWPNVEEKIEHHCRFYFNELGFRLTVVDSLGRILGDSGYSSDRMEPHMTDDRPEILAALDGKRGEDVRFSRTMQAEYRYLAEPVLQNGTPVAAVRIAVPVAEIHKSRRMVLHGVLIGFAVMFLAAMILSPLLLHYLWYKPLRVLNDEARRIADGNLEPAIPVAGPLEMVQLSQSLETMRRTVSVQLETITRQRESLQTILRHLPDAIFAINRSAEVIYFNAAAKKLFRIESAPDHPFLQEFVRNAAVIDWYLQHLTATPHLANTPLLSPIERKEVDLFGRKHFLELEFVCTDNAAQEDAAYLVIVSNVTESVRASKMKTDFVANASHELRTPLAAISVALDNISEEVYGDKETLRKIVQVVDRHVSRLGALLEDLLDLQGVEDETVPVRFEETTVAEQRSWIEELFHQRIDEKGLVFTADSDFGDAPFRVDNKRLGLILQNLLDNAIKFTPPGGEVSLHFRREEPFLVIECRDTGLGIAMEEQERVFERFYQGDSSKTGDGRLRGTGLGLAIVKHAVERLKGKISLESRIAQGSVFTVCVPVD